MTKEELQALLARYEAGTCSAHERAQLEQWFAGRGVSSDWCWRDAEEQQLTSRYMKSHITAALFPGKRYSVRPWPGLAVAALIVCCCMVGIWLYTIRENNVGPDQYIQQAVDPGSRAAFLTLADGKTIRLDETPSGTVYADSTLAIRKASGGTLTYEVQQPARSLTAEERNTLSVPRGGQYRLTLPDGTHVRVSSASKLTFPSALAGGERLVILSGEAYFEVAEDERRPFRVKTGDTDITVKGTHFNVAAYPDEQRVVTTLVEGAVQVDKHGRSALLAPGHQAITTAGSTDILMQRVDTDFALAWLHGDFLFEDQDIYMIMRNISRWYNVEVTFEGQIPEQRFSGSYTKSKGLADLVHHLRNISRLDIQLINERRVKVMP